MLAYGLAIHFIYMGLSIWHGSGWIVAIRPNCFLLSSTGPSLYSVFNFLLALRAFPVFQAPRRRCRHRVPLIPVSLFLISIYGSVWFFGNCFPGRFFIPRIIINAIIFFLKYFFVETKQNWQTKAYARKSLWFGISLPKKWNNFSSLGFLL